MYEKHRERHIQRSRDYRAQNPDKVKASSKRYKQAHPEQVYKWRKSWYANNPGKQSEYYHKNKGRYRELYALHRRLYRVRLYGALGSHTVEEIKALYKKQCGACAYCGVLLKGAYHADHIIPLVRGGSDYIENIACACPRCNRSKHDKTLEEWMKVRGW